MLRCFLILICPLAAVAADPLAPTQAIRATLLELHDGDTARVDILLPFGVTLPNRPIRAYGYDAWEVTRTRQTVSVTADEIAKGKAARDDLLTLMQSGELWVEDSGERDPYGRVSAWLWVRQNGRWVFVPGWMERRGHLRTPRSNE